MSHLFITDSEEYPDLFDFRLPASPQEIEAVEHELRARLPPSFRQVLATIGQGSFFDNETLFGVHETEEGVGDILSVNRELHDKQDLDPSLVVFHLGSGGLHAFDTQSAGPEHEVVALDEDTLARGVIYECFETWYEVAMRGEYRSLLGI